MNLCEVAVLEVVRATYIMTKGEWRIDFPNNFEGHLSTYSTRNNALSDRETNKIAQHQDHPFLQRLRNPPSAFGVYLEQLNGDFKATHRQRELSKKSTDTVISKTAVACQDLHLWRGSSPKVATLRMHTRFLAR